MNIAFPSFALDNQSIIMNPLSSYLRSEQRNVSSRPSFLRKYRLNIQLQFIWWRSEHSFRYKKSQAKCINFWLDGSINIHRLVYRLPVYLELHVPGAGKGERGDAGYGDPLLP